MSKADVNSEPKRDVGADQNGSRRGCVMANENMSELVEVELAEAKYDELGFVTGFICPDCGSPIREAYVDDAGTRWFKCSHCGKYYSRPKPVERIQLERELAEAKRLITLQELNEILATTVKRDESAKSLTFLGMLLAQTEEDQFNIAFQAESSTGKSYVPLELVEYFPEEERCVYGGASPTSFFHEVGVWDKERKVIRVDLAHKILIFLDQPHWMLMEKLRPLLSHDRKILTYKITDKREKAGLRTKTVELIGYPTVVFCTVKPTQEDQEKTRLWLLSPEASQEKLRESLWLIAKKEANREAFKKWLEEDPKRRWLKRRVALIRASGITNIVIPNEEQILNRYLNGRGSLKPRDQRDFPRLLRIIKGLALLNCFHREHVSPGTIEASEEDVKEAFKLYRMIAPSNELGLSPEIYDIFVKVIKPLFNGERGISKKEIAKKYLEVFHRPLQYRRLRDQVLPSLESAGLISQEPNPDNKREMLVYPTVVGDISLFRETPTQLTEFQIEQQYVPQNSGVGQKSPLQTSKNIECIETVSISAAQSLIDSDKNKSTAENVAKTPLQIEHADTKPEKAVSLECEAPTAISENHNPFLDKAPVKLERLTANVVDTCMNCRFNGRMDWQAMFPDGSWALLCYDCGLQLFRKIQARQEGATE